MTPRDRAGPIHDTLTILTARKVGDALRLGQPAWIRLSFQESEPRVCRNY
jgi:hypothetical protein